MIDFAATVAATYRFFPGFRHDGMGRMNHTVGRGNLTMVGTGGARGSRARSGGHDHLPLLLCGDRLRECQYCSNIKCLTSVSIVIHAGVGRLGKLVPKGALELGGSQ